MRFCLKGWQKASCSTMCKPRALLLMCLVLVLLTGFPISASASNSDIFFPENTNSAPVLISRSVEREDILLLYPTALSDDQLRTIEVLCQSVSALQWGMDDAGMDALEEKIDNYPYVIAYDLRGLTPAQTSALLGYRGRLLVLGTDLMTELFGTVSGSRSQGTRATLQYSFDNLTQFEDILPAKDAVLLENSSYSSGLLSFGSREFPFCQQFGRIRYIPLTDFTRPLPKAALMQELTNWLWIYQDLPSDYAQYLVLDEVYSFMPPARLRQSVDLCIEAKIPFVISVMPVYQNGDYPAMQQLCQVLQYAQANGGGVILHAPLMNSIPDLEQLASKLTLAIKTYTSQGVYPLGIQVPISWINRDSLMDHLARYQTLFLYDDDTQSRFTLDCAENWRVCLSHQVVHQAIALDGTGISQLTNHPAAIYWNSQQSLDSLQTILTAIRESRVPLQPLWDMPHSIWANNFHLDYRDNVLRINDIRQDLRFTPEAFDQNHDYHRNTLDRFTVSLENQNHFLMVLVAVSMLLFLILIVISRRQIRRSFFVDSKKNTKKKE